MVETAVLSIVRNEIDVLPAWLNHMRVFFDHCLIVNHRSDDGTGEYLSDVAGSDPRVRTYTFRDPEYKKELLVRALRKIVTEETNAEWIFILDPDEYLPYQTRAEFEQPLAAAGDNDVVRYRWRNLHLDVPGPMGLDFDCHRQVRPSRTGKVAMRRRVAADHRCHIPRGIHRIRVRGEALPSLDVGELYHVPLRSLEQAWEKVLRGSINRLRIMSKSPSSGNSAHYIGLLNALIADPTWATVRQLVYEYGDTDAGFAARALLSAEQFDREFEPYRASFSGMRDFATTSSETSPAAYSLQLGALRARAPFKSLMEELMTLDTDGLVALPDELRVSSLGSLVHPADFGERTFDALPDQRRERISLDEAVNAAQAAFWEIDRRTTASWGYHQPTLSSLVALLRPRTVVALGDIDGGRFFAICDAVHRIAQDTPCVSIASWTDEQLNNTRRRMKDQYGGRVGYIRREGIAAIDQFEDGSIDLLYLSGTKPTATITDEFDSWIAKLSGRGVVLVDHVTDFSDGAGAWRFWQRMKQQYLTFDLLSGGGLGILVVGEYCPFSSELEAPGIDELLQALYGGIGQMSWEVTQLHRRSRNGASADDQARITELEQRVKAMEASTSWRLTAPIRSVGRLTRRVRRR